MANQRLLWFFSLVLLMAVGVGCGFEQTEPIEVAQDAAGTDSEEEADENGKSAESGDEDAVSDEAGGEPGGTAGTGGTSRAGTGATIGTEPGRTGGSTQSGGAGASAGTVFECNPTQPPVTSCSGVPCPALEEAVVSVCEEICCTADGRCGKANTSQELARDCTASFVQHSDCPAEVLFGQQMVGCCRPDGRCGVDITEVMAIAEGFGYPVDDCLAREEIPDFQPYVMPLDPIACTP